ncbi:hypothetical protein PC129_g9026 [Phytophthora cactorum]|uniref:Uncharacterized protein n=1 Tax=Phytophthora cactorum TaxID=29920 RepID=A0A8T0Z957_9STRA|nr:hypothetical protein PC113_g9611 [Phytophthora cactorum]KAG2904211.1 hypothetical protein PC114_g11938 [Phytophthora cactorum]KAG2919240.1 hypothetical protein PC115_g10205 [Phytophthora cactorum]KAG3220219.1 hypothetical protein PC129_g9026 [Phytophthora cactorum]
MTRKSAKRTQSLSGVATSTHKRPRVLPGGSSADTLVEVVPASCPAHPAALELAGFINGVMHPEDEMDSMNLAAILRTVSANKLSKWQGQVIQTINRLGNFIVGAPTTAAASATGTQNRGSNDENLLIDRIGKLYQLIAQVQERQHKVELTGVSDPALAASLCKYHQRLQRYEDQLKAFEPRLLLNHQQSNGVSPQLLRQG